jgi:hypothetical protein
MDLAILFWFYKEREVCKNRLIQIRKYNPGIKIFGLYGGEDHGFSEYEKSLAEHLDDLYGTGHGPDSRWKWLNGDLMIVDWYINRGQFLNWDCIVIVQWDMLVFESLKKVFSDLKKEEIFITYYRRLTDEIERIWAWTRPGSKHRDDYLEFKSHIHIHYDYKGEMWCCGFILEIFPRSFLEEYSKIEDKEIGFIEYRVPTYANIFGYKFLTKDLGEWYEGDKDKSAINAWGVPISEGYIRNQLSQPKGFRLFHPYYTMWGT